MPDPTPFRPAAEPGPAEALALAGEAAQALRDALGQAPRAAVVLGSGLGAVAEQLGSPVGPDLDLVALPGFVPAGAPGHRQAARLVDVDGTPVLVLLGRVHLYEGLGAAQVVHGVRTAVLAGAEVVALTNAAGALDPHLRVGELALVADHLDWTGDPGPLSGLQPPPFLDLTDAWSPRLRLAARHRHPGLAEAVYAQVRGPQLETPALVRALRALGCDLVGMSTALEAVAARHLGAELLGLSVVVNLAAGVDPGPVHVEDLAARTAEAVPAVADVLRTVLGSAPRR
ncbi:purine-nucleoside phosphorylase [Aciditerrimonas ferrireducens]|uniref:purine-nucleoside phosphorylase n=1 Tax=Aciditerrimonas ferrireducens TaxID=667306 RepID=UPI002006590B|nr:purine-nucleoside phosphorylase [Aciditerrimonas ferrireducens]MCK4177471.1 purine-nucleoside phosphorylase [Aciditerrimonas ferrireducens]